MRLPTSMPAGPDADDDDVLETAVPLDDLRRHAVEDAADLAGVHDPGLDLDLSMRGLLVTRPGASPGNPEHAPSVRKCQGTRPGRRRGPGRPGGPGPRASRSGARSGACGRSRGGRSVRRGRPGTPEGAFRRRADSARTWAGRRYWSGTGRPVCPTEATVRKTPEGRISLAGQTGWPSGIPGPGPGPRRGRPGLRSRRARREASRPRTRLPRARRRRMRLELTVLSVPDHGRDGGTANPSSRPRPARSAAPHARPRPKRKFAPTTTARARRARARTLLRERRARKAEQGAVEGDDEDAVDPRPAEAGEPLVEGLNERDVAAAEGSRRVGEERQDQRPESLAVRQGHRGATGSAGGRREGRRSSRWRRRLPSGNGGSRRIPV